MGKGRTAGRQRPLAEFYIIRTPQFDTVLGIVMSAQKPRIHQHRNAQEIVYRLLDVGGIFLGLMLAVRLEIGQMSELYWLAGAAATIIYFLLCEMSGMYRNWRGDSLEREIFCSALTWAATIPVLLALSVMVRYSEWVDRWCVLIWTVLTLAINVGVRIVLRSIQCHLRSRGYNTRGFAIVGVNELGFELASRIAVTPELGLKLIGFYDDRHNNRLKEIPARMGQRLGTIPELIAAARAGRVNMIFITFPMRAEHRIKGVLAQLGDTTASVYIVPDFFVFELLHSRWTNIGGLPAVSVFENPFYGIDGFVKRAVDLMLASILMVAVSVPMVVIAALIKLTSPGPAFFRQKRYGLDGREIMVWKFRSMRVCESGDDFTQATRDDPRTTALGALLRKTSLDELPQLFNVLEGSMSLVGPRPHASMQNEEYRSLIQGYMLRHKVKPGMTGLAQVNGWRGETDTLEKMERRVECDHRYIREWSLFMDLKILLRTVFVVLSRQNAY
jgi:putative colanic acid biosynthesis UDP-glucose lipid carrier transferase